MESSEKHRRSALLRKLSVYFLLQRWEIWRSCRLRNTHRTQVLVAPDAAPTRPVRCLTLARVSRAHRTLAPDAGRTLFARPM